MDPTRLSIYEIKNYQDFQETLWRFSGHRSFRRQRCSRGSVRPYGDFQDIEALEDNGVQGGVLEIN
jgi:hypothetical protein